jgi:peptide deformylase
MVLPIVMYGHPVLRQKGARIDSVSPEITRLIGDMLESMRAHNGVGLAAQQIGRALQLTVVDVREVTDRPSWAERDGKKIDLNELMPLVLINPVLTPVGEAETGPEGCLSFPELFADISRPAAVDVRAQDAAGKPLAFRCGGLLARAVQHEVDHLNGILFIDRMNASDKNELQPELDELQAETRASLQQPVQ